MPRGGDSLDAQQLEQGADEDIGASAEQIGAKHFVAVGAVLLSHAAEGAHPQFQQHLQLAGHIPEAGHRKQAQADGQHQQHHRHHIGRNKAGVDVADAEQADPAGLVKDGVPHDFLHAFGLAAGAAGQDGGDCQHHDQGKPQDKFALILLHGFGKTPFIPFISV